MQAAQHESGRRSLTAPRRRFSARCAALLKAEQLVVAGQQPHAQAARQPCSLCLIRQRVQR